VTAIRPLVAGNWKMNGLSSSLGELRALLALLARGPMPGVDVMICPPATLLDRALEVVRNSGVLLGGQDCHPETRGAHTGDISAEMLADAGAKAVIVGHSERRQDHGETDALIAAKADAAYRAGLLAIICVGETEAERRDGRTLAVVGAQVGSSVPDAAKAANTVIAYEPVWAIGTGLTPMPSDVAEVHGFLRERLRERLGAEGERIRLLYGGSVKSDNARALLGTSDVNGALVGGASLKASDFYAILSAYLGDEGQAGTGGAGR
jgi:triosephosphate isomerase